IACALVYALGRYTPLFEWAFDWILGINKFRRPVDADFVLVAALALLVGQLLADYVRMGLPRRRILASVAIAAGVVAMLVWAVTFPARSGRGTRALLEVLKALPIVLGVTLTLTFAGTPRARAAAAAVVTLVAIADLMWWNVAFRLDAETRATYAVLEQPKPAD